MGGHITGERHLSGYPNDVGASRVLIDLLIDIRVNQMKMKGKDRLSIAVCQISRSVLPKLIIAASDDAMHVGALHKSTRLTTKAVIRSPPQGGARRNATPLCSKTLPLFFT